MFLIFRDEVPAEQTVLTKEELQHARARRLSAGAVVQVGDGRRTRRSGALAADGRTIVFSGEVGTPGSTEFCDEPDRTLCTAIPSGGRWDWLVQKAVEVGVTRILPIDFERSERGAVGRRIERVVEAAAAQAQRVRLPVVNMPLTIQKLPVELGNTDAVFVLDPTAEVSLTHPDTAEAVRPAVLVGPEGGFTKQEQDFFKEAGFRPRRLGRNVLRIETAAIVALGRFL